MDTRGVVILGAVIGAVAIGLWVLAARITQRQIRRQRLERLDKLAEFGQAILGAQLQLDVLCEVVFEQASRLIDTSNFQLGLFDDQDYVIMVWQRDGERLPTQRFPGAARDGIIGWIARTGKELLVQDFEREWDTLPARPSYHAQRPYRSGLYAPLVAGGTPIGVIAVQNELPGAFSEDDLRLLMVLTNLAAGAIQNAQLFEQTQARNRQLQLVSEVSQQVVAAQPLADLFEQIVTLIQRTFGYYVTNLFTLDEKDKVLRLQASTHPTFRQRFIQLPLGTGLVGWAAQYGAIAMAADVHHDHRYFDDGILNETRAEIAVPLVVERRVLGVLDVQSNQVGAFTQDDANVLETLASQVALAIQEAETYAAERRQRERLNALTEASRAVVSILNIDDLLDEVVDLLADYFGFDRTHIFLLDDNRIVFRAGSGTHSERWAIDGLSYEIDGPGIIPRSLRTLQPVICSDVRDDPDYIPSPELEDTRSEMVIPIRMGAQTFGVLDIQSTELNAFSADDATLAEALADSIAVALRNAALYAREKRRRVLAESLREVSLGLGASLEVDRVLNGVLNGLQRVVPMHAACIALLDKDALAYRITAAFGFTSLDLLDEAIPAGLDFETRFHGMLKTASAELQHGIELVQPLPLGEEPIGYLGLVRSGRFSAEDREMIAAFAMQSAMAIANAELYMAQREEAWVSTALLQVAEATARAETLDEVLRTVARITPLLVGVEWCGVLLAEQSQFRIVEVEGIPPELDRLYVGHTFQPHRWPPLQQLLETHRPVILDQHEIPLPSSADPGTASLPRIEQGIMLPLYVKGEIVGAMLIGQQQTEAPLSRRKLEMLGGIANQAALAIESAQLTAAQQEEAWVTTALLQVAEAVNAQVELESTLATIVRLTPMLVGVNHCIVFLWDAAASHFCQAISHGLPQPVEENLNRLTLHRDQHPFLTAVTRSTQAVMAGPGQPFELPSILRTYLEADAALGFPLTAQGKLKGMMLVDDPEHDIADDPRRMNILAGIAWQTATAIETNQLQLVAAERQRLEQELEVAKSIQTSFLPETNPRIPGWDVGAYYRAARMVGGDFYDFMPLPNGRWGLVIADVADKGMPAALYMALCRTLLRAVARNRDDPAETLMRVNTLLLEDTRSDLFVTIWYGIWNPADGSITYSSAGHNPPLVLRHGETVPHILRLRGIALGVLPDIQLQTQRIILEPGDMLVLYTDGITEALDPQGMQLELSRLGNVITENTDHAAADIIKAVIDTVDAHSGAEPQFDDLTLVVVRHCADSDAPPPNA
ncbi:MAG: hypothetical protein Kow0077_04580 [Anaerolineae bacterium]